MSQKHFTHEVFLTHEVSLDLLDYLCPVHKKKVLRVDAFRDLLNKTAKQPLGAMTKEGTPLVVESGQLVTSVSELARVWDWHRDKVRDFVNALAEREVLTIDMHKKFMVLSFPNLADRIAAFAVQAGSAASVALASDTAVKPVETECQMKDAPVTHVLDTAVKAAPLDGGKSGTDSGGWKREEGGAATANHGGYMQPSLFPSVDNADTHQVPASTNLKVFE